MINGKAVRIGGKLYLVKIRAKLEPGRCDATRLLFIMGVEREQLTTLTIMSFNHPQC